MAEERSRPRERRTNFFGLSFHLVTGSTDVSRGGSFGIVYFPLLPSRIGYVAVVGALAARTYAGTLF